MKKELTLIISKQWDRYCCYGDYFHTAYFGTCENFDIAKKGCDELNKASKTIEEFYSDLENFLDTGRNCSNTLTKLLSQYLQENNITDFNGISLEFTQPYRIIKLRKRIIKLLSGKKLVNYLMTNKKQLDPYYSGLIEEVNKWIELFSKKGCHCLFKNYVLNNDDFYSYTLPFFYAEKVPTETI